MLDKNRISFMNSLSGIELKRFNDKIIKQENGCWIWQGAKTNGRYIYGNMTFRKENYLAHVFSCFFIGKNPEALRQNVLHRCDICLCVNPNHLFTGTQRDNVKDMLNKNREARGEKHGLTTITNEQAETIRAIYPRLTYRQLANRYNVSESCIGRIIRKESYVI